jgi:hypothetical protein
MVIYRVGEVADVKFLAHGGFFQKSDRSFNNEPRGAGGDGMEVKLAAKGSLTTGWAETIGQRGAGAAWEVPQSLSDYNHCKGKQITVVQVFYA